MNALPDVSPFSLSFAGSYASCAPTHPEENGDRVLLKVKSEPTDSAAGITLEELANVGNVKTEPKEQKQESSQQRSTNHQGAISEGRQSLKRPLPSSSSSPCQGKAPPPNGMPSSAPNSAPTMHHPFLLPAFQSFTPQMVSSLTGSGSPMYPTLAVLLPPPTSATSPKTQTCFSASQTSFSASSVSPRAGAPLPQPSQGTHTLSPTFRFPCLTVSSSGKYLPIHPAPANSTAVLPLPSILPFPARSGFVPLGSAGLLCLGFVLSRTGSNAGSRPKPLTSSAPVVGALKRKAKEEPDGTQISPRTYIENERLPRGSHLIRG